MKNKRVFLVVQPIKCSQSKHAEVILWLDPSEESETASHSCLHKNINTYFKLEAGVQSVNWIKQQMRR